MFTFVVLIISIIVEITVYVGSENKIKDTRMAKN